jgi:hypothetical protein
MRSRHGVGLLHLLLPSGDGSTVCYVLDFLSLAWLGLDWGIWNTCTSTCWRNIVHNHFKLTSLLLSILIYFGVLHIFSLSLRSNDLWFSILWFSVSRLPAVYNLLSFSALLDSFTIYDRSTTHDSRLMVTISPFPFLISVPRFSSLRCIVPVPS